MRKITLFAIGTTAAAMLAVSGAYSPVLAQTQATSGQSSSSQAGTSSTKTTTSVNTGGANTPAEDPLAAAARKAREQKKQAAKPAKVFTNDNLPTEATISSVGTGAPPPITTSSSSDKGEQYWRDKFDKLHKKLDQDQAELAVMQRELGQLNLQNYSDPVKGMQQSYSRSDIDKKTADIDAKKKEIDADQQAIEDAESDMQKAGGEPGWAR